MSRLRLDVLQTRPGRRLLRSAAFPLALQAAALAALAFLAVNGWGVGAGATGGDLKLLRKTSLTTLAVWGLWWPGMIALAIFLGRAWCTVCPLELLARLGRVAGRPLGLARLPLAGWLRAGWAALAAYGALQLLVAGVSIHRVPHHTAVLLAVLGATALAAGLLFREPRAFCKALCPAAPLLSVYGRATPVQLDVRSPERCEACETKDCVDAARRERLDARGCPSLLRPFARAPSDGCVLCLQCAKACPEGNVGLGLAAPDAPSRARTLLRPAEAAFVAVAAGFVTHELAGEVPAVERLFHAVPEALGAPASAFAWIEAAWFLVVFPAALWLAIAGVARLLGHRAPLRDALLAAATGAAPVIAVAHLAKAAAKVSSWAGFLPLALRDPRGLETFAALRAGQPAPGALVPLAAVGAALAGAVLVLAARAWRRPASEPDARPRRAGVAMVAGLLGGVLVAWVVA